MEEEIKDAILKYINSLKEPQSLTQISENLEYSYPTILKYCDILIMERKIQVKDYGNVKLIKPIK